MLVFWLLSHTNPAEKYCEENEEQEENWSDITPPLGHADFLLIFDLVDAKQAIRFDRVI